MKNIEFQPASSREKFAKYAIDKECTDADGLI